LHGVVHQLSADEHDAFEHLPDGNCRRAYRRYDDTSSRCGDAVKHSTGWAMRNTNNHNPAILKKSCLGVLVCSARLTACPSRPALHLKPAICHKARAKQIGQIPLYVSATRSQAQPPYTGYDTRDAVVTCAQKLTRVSLIYRTEPTAEKWKTEK